MGQNSRSNHEKVLGKEAFSKNVAKLLKNYTKEASLYIPITLSKSNTFLGHSHFF